MNDTVLESLWTFQTVGITEPTLLKELMYKAGTPEVRAAAVRVAADWIAEQPRACKTLAAMRAGSVSPRAVGSGAGDCQDSKQSRSGGLGARCFGLSAGPLAGICVMADLPGDGGRLAAALKAGKFQFGGDARKMAFALEAVGSPEVVSSLDESAQTKHAARRRAVGSSQSHRQFGRAAGISDSYWMPPSMRKWIEPPGWRCSSGWPKRPANAASSRRAMGAGFRV